MLKCSSRSYFARYTIILITSRDFAILLLYRCLRHSHIEHELRTIFHHLKFLRNDRNVSDCPFWKNFYKRKISFSLIFCTQNRHSTMIENYIKRDDVIKCKFDYLIFIEIWFIIELSQIIVTKRVDDCHNCRKQRYRSRIATESRDVIMITWCD